MGWGEEGGSGRGPFLSLGVVNILNLSFLQFIEPKKLFLVVGQLVLVGDDFL